MFPVWQMPPPPLGGQVGSICAVFFVMGKNLPFIAVFQKLTWAGDQLFLLHEILCNYCRYGVLLTCFLNCLKFTRLLSFVQNSVNVCVRFRELAMMHCNSLSKFQSCTRSSGISADHQLTAIKRCNLCKPYSNTNKILAILCVMCYIIFLNHICFFKYIYLEFFLGAYIGRN